MSQLFDELDQLSFSPAQKEALVRRLTRLEETPFRPPRALYRAAIALTVVASLLIGAAGATYVAGVSPVFREMFGITTQEDEALIGAVRIQQTFQDKNGTGAAITVREVVRDQQRLFILVDFIAPQDCVLPEPEHPYPYDDRGYWIDGDEGDAVGEMCLNYDLFQDKACTQRANWQSLGFVCSALDDDDPSDNVVPLMLVLDETRFLPPDGNYLRLRNIFNLRTYRGGEVVSAVEGMDMEMVIPVSTSTPIYRFTGRCGAKLNRSTFAVVEDLAVSPLSISMDLILSDGEAYDALIKEQGGVDAYVLLKDDTRVPLRFNKSYGTLDWFYTEEGERFFRCDHVYFTPSSPIDLSQIKDIVFVGDNDPEKMGQNVHYNFHFYPTRFSNDVYWSEVDPLW